MGRRRSAALRDMAGVYHVASRLASEGFHAAEGEGDVCEWGMGEGGAPAEEPGPFVALVDLKRDKDMPRVWVLPSAEVRARVASPGDPRPYRYRASAEELEPHEDDWYAIKDHLLRSHGPRTRWFDRQELAGCYGEGFAEALDTEASRLLGVENSTIRRMADERFPAEDLADASALLSALFRRYMQEQRDRREEEYRRRKRERRS